MKNLKLEHEALSYVEHPDHDGSDHIWVTGKMVVCQECGGTGSHVRKDLDDSQMVDDMREDGNEEGLRAYFSGAFDEQCRVCGGANVVLAPDPDSVPKWAQDAIDSWNQSQWECEEISRQERRMGA